MKTLQQQVDQVRRLIDDTAHVRPLEVRLSIFAELISQLNSRLYKAIYRSLVRQRNENPHGATFTLSDYQQAVTEAALELEGKTNNGAC